MATGARTSGRRDRTEPDEERAERVDAAAPPHAEVLALQRTAGNAAVARLLSRSSRTLARFDDGQVSSRAVGIWEEKGSPQGQSAEQQGADWNESKRQVGGMERETTRRAEALYQQRGGESTPEQAQQDWAQAEKSIVTDFACARTDDWTKLLGRAALWTGPPGEPQTALTAIKAKLGELNTHLNEKDDLGARLTLITDAEGLIDGWLATHGAGQQAKADELLMLKMHTLAYERRRRLKMLKLQDEYGVKVNSALGVLRHKQAFAPGTTLGKVAEKTGLSLFSLDELDMLLTVCANYAPLLGKQRDAKLGAQPLQNFTRFKVGLDQGPDPMVDEPVQSPGDFGVTILDTITMYDKSSTDTLDFPTPEQQFRGTIEHELSHALLEPLIAAGGDTMLKKFSTDMAFWGGSVTVPSGAVGAEAPPTNYGRKTAQEDLAECMMFFFEDPKDLQTRCPQRFTWIKDNLGSVLGPEHMKTINEGKF